MQETGQRIDQARKVTASFCVYESQEEGAYGIKTLSQIGERCIWEGTVNERRDGNTAVVPDTENPIQQEYLSFQERTTLPVAS